jgi:Tfp pilus assembly protein PilN
VEAGVATFEVNLLPGSSPRPGRRRPGLSLSVPRIRVRGVDRWVAMAVVAWLAAPAALGWLYLDAQTTRTELEDAIHVAVQDSARYAGIIAATQSLQARRDTVAQKLQIIQEIDAGRYVWAHILDEVSRALPDYTWLTGLAQITGGSHPRFRIEGRTGNNIALTRFMKDLESSPFLREVKLTSTQQVRENEDLVYAFMLEASYEDPPTEYIGTVPLFPEIG